MSHSLADLGRPRRGTCGGGGGDICGGGAPRGRLARNRESARLRRLRKKELVDKYEQDVARLEHGIRLLQLHRYGARREEQLAEALATDTGDNHPPEGEARERRRHALLAQQAEHVQELAAATVEGLALSLCIGGVAPGSLPPASAPGVGAALTQLREDLMATLAPDDAERERLQKHAAEVPPMGLLDVLVLEKVARVMRSSNWHAMPSVKESLAAFEDIISKEHFQRLCFRAGAESAGAESAGAVFPAMPAWAVPCARSSGPAGEPTSPFLHEPEMDINEAALSDGGGGTHV
ncbi:unnamed protein product [Phaeothamnion confervicola]